MRSSTACSRAMELALERAKKRCATWRQCHTTDPPILLPGVALSKPLFDELVHHAGDRAYRQVEVLR